MSSFQPLKWNYLAIKRLIKKEKKHTLANTLNFKSQNMISISNLKTVIFDYILYDLLLND